VQPASIHLITQYLPGRRVAQIKASNTEVGAPGLPLLQGMELLISCTCRFGRGELVLLCCNAENFTNK